MEQPSRGHPPSKEELEARLQDTLTELAGTLLEMRKHHGHQAMFIGIWSVQFALLSAMGMPYGLGVKAIDLDELNGDESEAPK